MIDEQLREAIQASGYQTPAEWLTDALGGAKSEAGIRVNYREAMGYAYVYSAVTIIASDVARLPLNEYRIEPDEDLVKDRDSYAWWILNGEANEYQSGYSLRETLTAHALLRGNGLAAIERDMAGRPLRLIPIMPGTYAPRFASSRELVWDVQPGGGAEALTIADSDVLNIRDLGEDGVIGHSRLTLARNAIGLGIAQERHGSRHFASGAKPSLVLKHPRPLNKEQADQLLDSWQARHGDGNVRPALAHGGLDIEILPISNSDAQWLGSREFSARQIAVWFQLPPHKLGDTARAGYNGVEAEERAYLSQCLQRWLTRWEDEATRKLIPRRARVTNSRRMAHDTWPLVSGDMQTKSSAASALRLAEILSANEARRWFGLPSVEGGDDRTNPNKATPLAKPEAPEAPEPEDDGEDAAAPVAPTAAHRRLLAATLDRMARIEADRVSAAAKTPDGFLGRVDAFYDGFTATLAAALDPVFAVCGEVGGRPLDATTWAGEHCAESCRQLLDVAGRSVPAELAAEVSATVAGWSARSAAVVSSVFCGS